VPSHTAVARATRYRNFHPQRLVAWDTWEHEELACAVDRMVSDFWRQFTKHHPRTECWRFTKELYVKSHIGHSMKYLTRLRHPKYHRDESESPWRLN
jgi:hypothetical protein